MYSLYNKVYVLITFVAATPYSESPYYPHGYGLYYYGRYAGSQFVPIVLRPNSFKLSYIVQLNSTTSSPGTTGITPQICGDSGPLSGSGLNAAQRD